MAINEAHLNNEMLALPKLKRQLQTLFGSNCGWFTHLLKLVIHLQFGCALCAQQIRVQGLPLSLETGLVSYLSKAEKTASLLENPTLLLLKAANYLRSEGYYSAKLSLDESENTLILRSLGPRVMVKAVNITFPEAALAVPGFAKLVTVLKAKRSFPLVHSQYEQFKQRSLEALKEAGYLDATWHRHDFEVDINQSAAVWNFDLSLGPAYYIGTITCEPSPLDPARVASITNPFVNQPPTPERLSALASNLMETNWFSSVVTSIKKQPGQSPVDLDVQLTPAKALQVELKGGAEFINGHWQPSFRLRATLPRMTTLGMRLESEIWLGKVKFPLPIYIPLKYVSLDFSCPRGSAVVREKVFTRIELGEPSQKISTGLMETWFPCLAVGYRWKDLSFYLTTLDTEINLFVLLSRWAEEAELLKRNHPSKGITSGCFLGAASEIQANLKWIKGVQCELTGQTSLVSTSRSENLLAWQGLRWWVQNRDVISLKRSWKCIVSLGAGGLNLGVTKDQLDTWPYSMRFFLGGENSLRGYPSNSFCQGVARYPVQIEADQSAQDASIIATSNQPVLAFVGGACCWCGSGGLSYQLTDKLWLGPFIDFGNATQKWGSWNEGLGVSVGLQGHLVFLFGIIKGAIGFPCRTIPGGSRSAVWYMPGIYLSFGPTW